MERTAVVVEDQADIRALLTAILESSDYVVHGAEDGLEAVELIRAVSPEVTTLDVNIPGIDGFEVARRVRAFSDTYIIFISAFVETGDAERGRAAGGDEYLGKPFRPRELRARLAGIPSHRRRNTPAVVEVSPAMTASEASAAGFGDLTMAEGRLLIGEIALDVTPGDVAVARQLIAAHGRVRTKDELALGLRARPREDEPGADEVRDVERAVETLRRALVAARSMTQIESQRGLGYRLVSLPPSTA